MVLVLVGGVYIGQSARPGAVQSNMTHTSLPTFSEVVRNGASKKFQAEATWPKRALPIRPALRRENASLTEESRQDVPKAHPEYNVEKEAGPNGIVR